MNKLGYDKRRMLDYGDCKMSHCKRKAGTMCRNHNNELCYVCAIQFHNSCDVKIENDILYLHYGIEIAKINLDSIIKNNEENKIDEFDSKFQESLKDLKKQYKLFSEEMNEYLVDKDPFIIDDMHKKARKMIDDIEKSEAYKKSCCVCVLNELKSSRIIGVSKDE